MVSFEFFEMLIPSTIFPIRQSTLKFLKDLYIYVYIIVLDSTNNV